MKLILCRRKRFSSSAPPELVCVWRVCSFPAMDYQAFLSGARKLTPAHVGIGIAIGFVLSPLIGALLALLLPVVFVVSLLVAAAVAYAVFKLKANISDWLLFKGLIKPRIQQMMAAKKNYTTDVWWYHTYEAQSSKEKPFIVQAEDGTEFTWEDMERTSNRVANWGLSQKWPAGMSVALFMPNRPEFVAMWLGNAKIGVVTALINTNLRKHALIHSFKVGECKAIVYDAELADALKEVLDELRALQIPLFQFDGLQSTANELGATLLKPLLDQAKVLRVPDNGRAVARGAKYSETIFLIYTSGTTGLPKAARITHHRFRLIGSVFGELFTLAADRLYCPLPLYHSAGGMIGIGCGFQTGCTIVLRKKFSASAFVKDCVKYQVTGTQYIGELARYLLATPANPEEEQKLTLRFAVGNGLRPDVWAPFKSRFGIKRICEFYGATEGASALLNVADVENSIGYLSPIVNLIMPTNIIKFDHDKEEPIRDKVTGLCIPCEPGEAGEFVARIVTQNGASNFSGYTDKGASDKKLLRNVFADGDSWFRSGDLLKRDERNNVYFVDRIGDTFRWKGENVATSEVAQVVGTFKGNPEANVYGVEIPKNDGRAGMAALYNVNIKTFDFAGFAAHLLKELPHYAIPRVLRFMPVAETTSTFKHLKVHLRKEGFDINAIKDPMYFFDGKTYVPLTPEIFAALQKGEIRV